MFSSQIDRRASPFRLSNAGAVAGSFLLLTTAAALVSPKTIPFLLPAVVLGHVAFLAARAREGREAWLHFGRPEFMLAMFLVWAGIAAFWSLDPERALIAVGLALAITMSSAVTAKGMASESRGAVVRMAEGLWIGFALALVYFIVELLTNQSLKIWAYNLLDLGPGDVKANWVKFRDGQIVAIDPVDLTRSAAPISLLLWPSTLAVLGAVARRWRTAIAAPLVLLASGVVALCPHETSKLALVAGGLSFVLARFSAPWVWSGLAAVWISACLLAAPAALLAHRLDLHNAPWLPRSAQHRIIIWNYTAEKALEAPLFGAGPLSTYVTGQFVKPHVESLPGEATPRTLSQHAHNVYLQTWYELGFVGAFLLAGVGAAFIGRLRRLAANLQPYAAAAFTSAMVIAGASYGMWQTWFMAMFGLAAIAFAVGARALETR